MNDEYLAKRYTYKLTGGKQNTCLTRRSLDETIATIDCWLRLTGCRLAECKQLRTNDRKSNNPLPHNTEKFVGLVYSKDETHYFLQSKYCTLKLKTGNGSPTANKRKKIVIMLFE